MSNRILPSSYHHWQLQSKEICEMIESRKAKAKVILKTRNETLLLSNWIEHHIAIFGSDGIVIFDNESDNPETFRVYEKYIDAIQVFFFSGHCDAIHNTERKYRELYQAIRNSCEYYIFLDTDELLYWHEESGVMLQDAEVVERVINCVDKVVPGIWIEIARGRPDVLLYTFQMNRMLRGIRGGKPMIWSGLDLPRTANHNMKIDPSPFRSCVTANLIVLHLRNLSASQRISANLQKLQSFNDATSVLKDFGFQGRNFSLDDVLAIDENAMRGGKAKNYVREIKSLSRENTNSYIAEPSSGTARLIDGRLTFEDPSDETAIRGFLANPGPVFHQVFGGD